MRKSGRSSCLWSKYYRFGPGPRCLQPRSPSLVDIMVVALSVAAVIAIIEPSSLTGL